MELHGDGTALEINTGRDLILAIRLMSEDQRSALPADVQCAYNRLWQMWLVRREKQHSMYCVYDGGE